MSGPINLSSNLNKAERIAYIDDKLQSLYPETPVPLDHRDPYTLLIAVLLSAQAPLLYEAMGWGKISVGFPWFNSMFVTFMPFMILLMGIGPRLVCCSSDVLTLVLLHKSFRFCL